MARKVAGRTSGVLAAIIDGWATGADWPSRQAVISIRVIPPGAVSSRVLRTTASRPSSARTCFRAAAEDSAVNVLIIISQPHSARRDQLDRRQHFVVGDH